MTFLVESTLPVAGSAVAGAATVNTIAAAPVSAAPARVSLDMLVLLNGQPPPAEGKDYIARQHHSKVDTRITQK